MAKPAQFKCGSCGRTFGMAAHLGRHMSTVHGAKKPVAARRPAARRGRPPMVRIPAATDGLGRVRQDIEACRSELIAQRDALDTQLAALDEVLASLGAAVRPAHRPVGRPAGRPKAGAREGSLPAYIVRVLRAAGGPLAVKDITAGVLKAGYRTQNKTLAKSVGNYLAEMPSVARVSRGMFRLK